MPKFLVVIQDFGTEEPELKVVEGNSYDEVFDNYEHNQRNLIVVELTTEAKTTLKEAIIDLPVGEIYQMWREAYRKAYGHYPESKT